MWLIIYIRRGVFVARFDRSGKFEDLKAGTGNSEGSTLLVYETSVSACFPILTSGKGPKDSLKLLIMANYRLRGRALINGVVGKDFEVIVPLSTDTGSQIKIDAIKRIHPDWKEIVVSSWERV